MRVWLVTVGEPMPMDGPDVRLYRTGILAGFLCRKGHDVVWWASSFDHVRKAHRVKSHSRVVLENGCQVILIKTRGYKGNVSLGRLLDHRALALDFAGMAVEEPEPDVILCSMPTIELAREAVKYGVQRRIPVVLDIRDLWPEIFLELIPAFARSAGRMLLAPLFRDLRKACSMTAGITGITPLFVQWGVTQAGRAMGASDRDFPLGYIPRDRASRTGAGHCWEGLAGERTFLVCFFGALSRQFDLDTVIETARRLEGGPRTFTFVLCGTGDKLDHFRRRAEGLTNIHFPGWVDSSTIWSLMRASQVGLAPYRSSPSFRASLPNKSIEYLAAGLPLISSLQGELEKLLEENTCGLTYQEGEPGSLERALIALHDDRERLATLARNAQELFERSFSAEFVYGSMCDYLEAFTRKPQSASTSE